ncbi:MAG: hypothetical protein ACE5GQ_11165 [Nitrospinales bacterium]
MLDPDKILVLDTHVWIWLLSGDKKLASSKCLPAIDHAVKKSNIKISAISVWEVGMLESKGRIKFSLSCLDWGQ